MKQLRGGVFALVGTQVNKIIPCDILTVASQSSIMDQAYVTTGKSGLLQDSSISTFESYHKTDRNDHGRATTEKNTADGEEEDIECFWRLADFGHIPPQSRDGSVQATDEVFNAMSHLTACLLSILGSVLLISQASAQGAPWKIVSFSIYGASLVFLFGASTLHHAIISTPAWERTFRVWDYLAIFPLIAGTFTPLCLVFFHNTVIGWTFFGTVWILALVSMFFVHDNFDKSPKWLTMTLYVTLGWLGAFLTFWLLPVIG